MGLNNHKYVLMSITQYYDFYSTTTFTVFAHCDSYTILIHVHENVTLGWRPSLRSSTYLGLQCGHGCPLTRANVPKFGLETCVAAHKYM